MNCWHSFEPWHTWMSVTLMNKTKCSWIQDCLVTAFSLENFGSPSDIWCHQQLPSLPQFSISFIYPSDFPGHFSNVFSTSLPQYTSVWILLFTVSNLYFNSATACCLPTSIHPFCRFHLSLFVPFVFMLQFHRSLFFLHQQRIQKSFKISYNSYKI